MMRSNSIEELRLIRFDISMDFSSKYTNFVEIERVRGIMHCAIIAYYGMAL